MNKLLMIQTRYVDRPLHKQFQVSLTKKPWVGTQADFAIAIHGSVLSNMTQDWDLIRAAQKQNQVKHVLDLRGVTNNRLPPFLYKTLTWASTLGYKYVGVFDDDAYYTRPEEAARELVRCFEELPLAGCTGPMGALRHQWRYRLDEGREPEWVEPMYRCPWACLGSQVYRVDALNTLDLSFLQDLKFRADAIISMLLHGKGWGNYEMPISFNHIVSAGLDSNPTSIYERIEFHERRVSQVSHDYYIYYQQLRKQCGEKFLQQMTQDVQRLEKSERNHQQKKLDKLRAEVGL